LRIEGTRRARLAPGLPIGRARFGENYVERIETWEDR
jgi:hypothetical protein